MSYLRMFTQLTLVQLLIYVMHICDASVVRVVATAPVNPVDEHGILSLHCQVWKITDIHEVTIFRTPQGGETQRLSVNENVLTNVDERIYLGVRKSMDGSTIYFLSIMGATRIDMGEYICKVFRVSGATVVEVAAGSVNITSTYFPSDPMCSSNGPLTAYAGSLLTLNCTSEAGNPHISIQWTRTDSPTPIKAEQLVEGKIVYKQLSLHLTPQDSNAIFFCRVTSRAYPNKVATCHIGPITVIGNNNGLDNEPTSSEIATKEPVSQVSVEIVTKSSVKSRCLKSCSPTKSNLFYWILATTITGFLAVFFLILGIYLLIRYYYLSNEDKRQRQDKIYSEVDADQMVYMSLQKRMKDYSSDHEDRFYS